MIENHVPGLNLCTELKRLGYPQETIHYWQWIEAHKNYEIDNGKEERKIAAPLMSEMAEWIINKKYVCPMWNEHTGTWTLNHPASGYSYRGSGANAYATQCLEILRAKEGR